jgi:hypothetical protein
LENGPNLCFRWSKQVASKFYGTYHIWLYHIRFM